MLIKSCEIASGECMNKPNKTVTIARAIIRIGDAARKALLSLGGRFSRSARDFAAGAGDDIVLRWYIS